MAESSEYPIVRVVLLTTVLSTSSDSQLEPPAEQFVIAGGDDDAEPVSKAVCIVRTFGKPEALAFRTTTVTIFSDRLEMLGLVRSRMNVSSLYDLWSGPVRVCTGEHCAVDPQLLIVTSVPLPGRPLSSVL